MRILLSAYACEPNKGSEPQVGWNWALNLAKQGHEVWVLTRSNNRENIEGQLGVLEGGLKLNFLYIDLPKWLTFWKRGNYGVHQYYFLWQLAAFRVAKKAHKKLKFDLVHHATFVSVRQPSFMGLLGIPFIFGPVAGGDLIPKPLRDTLPLSGQWQEIKRDLINYLSRIDPWLHLTFKTASRIYVNSSQTMDLVPALYRHKASVQLAIAASPSERPMQKEVVPSEDSPVRILYVGQLLYLKGIHIALKAFAQYHAGHPGSTFTILGDGPQKAWLQFIANKLGLDESIHWLPPRPREEVLKLYSEYDLFLFPSLRDSGGMVVIEALGNGLPVISLKLGGPGVLVNDTCGYCLSVEGKSEDEVCGTIAEALADFAESPEKRKRLAAGALKRVEFFSQEALMDAVYP